MNIINNK